MLLFGTLVIVIDLRIDGFDLINDMIGAVLVIIAVAGFPKSVPEPVRIHLPLLGLASIALIAAVAQQIDPESVVTSALGWSYAVGAWLTARMLATAFGDENDDIMAAQWSASERLLLWLGIVPIVGLSIVGWLIEPTGTGIAPIAVATLVLTFLPLLHLLVSLYRTTLLSPLLGDDAA